MNCQTCQRVLLQVERPGAPPAAVREHLVGCDACREWQRRLVQIEGNVPFLPVPPSHAKADLLSRLLSEPVASAEPELETPELETYPARLPYGTRILMRWAWAAGLAAAMLLLTVGGLWLLKSGGPQVAQHQPQEAPVAAADPLVANLLQQDLTLAQADSPRERVEALADLAADLHGETALLARGTDPEDLATLARLYGQVIRDGLIVRAGNLAAAERREVLEPIAQQLAQAADESGRLSTDVAGAAAPLRAMALAAREGDAQLRALLGDERRQGHLFAPPLRPVQQAVVRDPWQYGLLPVQSVVALAAAVQPAGQGPQGEALGRLRQFRRDRSLVEALVDGGLRLAGADDPLQRASYCKDLAKHLADTIKHATAERDTAWAGELGRYMQEVLETGVAANVTTARVTIPSGSEREQELERVAAQVVELTQPVEEQMQESPGIKQEEMKRALQAVVDGRQEVEKALKGHGKAKSKGAKHKRSGRAPLKKHGAKF